MAFYNFSFGSNMSSKRLFARLPNAKHIGTAILQNYALTFDMVSADGSAKCSITPSEQSGACVYGVVYQLSDDEKTKLDAIEGPHYDCVLVPVTLLSGEEIQAHCYIANTLDDTLLPYDWYLQHVYRGALEAGAPNEYSEAILQRESCPDPEPQRAANEFAIHDNKQ